MDVFDIVSKSATVIIAGCSLYFTRYVFLYNSKLQKEDKQKDRNVQSLKVIVLDHNLKHLYSFFEILATILNELKQTGLTDNQKSEILDKLADEFINVRIRFVDVLLAIDETLYNSIIEKLDTLQTHISDSVFDNGINLSHQPKFDSVILKKLTEFKTDVIKTLFQYKG